MLVEVFVKIAVVRRNHRCSCLLIHRDILRRVSVSSAGVKTYPIDRLLIIAFHEPHTTFSVCLDQGHHILRVYPAMRPTGLPSLAGVVRIFILLNPDASLWKEIQTIGVIPMHVSNDDVADV